MNAQGKWGFHYRLFIDADACNNRRRIFQRQNMYEIRREAALERKLAAAQRTITAQAQRIDELEDDVEQYQREQDDMNPWIVTQHDIDTELNHKFTQEAIDNYMRFLGRCH